MDPYRAVRRVAPLMVVLAIVAIGCGSSSKSTAPQTGLTQEGADDLALLASVSIDFIGGDLEGVVTTTPLGTAAVQGPARTLADTTYVRGSITYEASRTYYDAGDNPLAQYGPTAVRVNWISRAYGTSMGDRDTTEVGHAANISVTGIEASDDTLRFNGVAYDTLLSRFRSLDNTRMRYFLWKCQTVLADVRFLKSTLQGGPYPISGSVTFFVSADRLRSFLRTDIETHFDSILLIIFDGTTVADLVVDGKYHYTWDIETGTITRA